MDEIKIDAVKVIKNEIKDINADAEKLIDAAEVIKKYSHDQYVHKYLDAVKDGIRALRDKYLERQR